MRAIFKCALALTAIVSVPAMAGVGLGNLGTITVPFTENYGDTFAAGGAVPQFQGSFGGSLYNFNFSDDITFTVPTSTGTSVATTISLGSLLNIDDFQARLYSGSSVGTGAPGAGLVVESWGTMFNGPGYTVSQAVLTPTSLAAGTYTLNIRGFVSGTAGGSYGGVLNLASAVPEPSTGLAMLAGLAVLGLSLRRREG